jgi:predicted transglutaminase-like cysteine proteinase
MAPSATLLIGPAARSAMAFMRCERPAHFASMCLVIALLLGQVLLPWAWDSDRMLVAALKRGPLAVAGVRALQGELAAVQAATDAVRIEAINRFFNLRITYAEDIDTTGQVDDWASPIETLARGAGDCEDYAIAKYFSLIAAGVAPAKLRLVYVRAEMGGGSRAHMVLAYYPQPAAEPLILDNLDGRILPASARRDLSPVFSFNAEGLWEGAQGQAAGDPVARLSRWRGVLAKARAEGFV